MKGVIDRRQCRKDAASAILRTRYGGKFNNCTKPAVLRYLRQGTVPQAPMKDLPALGPATSAGRELRRRALEALCVTGPSNNRPLRAPVGSSHT
ncbi:hypothetical protein [Arthrobacter sp. GN70]|uniref:hypothetical protein n=1 Tax=Arthrobacter sp. GN70 TaxID=2838876 RepID=UPI001BFD871F|nr:hypothetical protein [Arthrobacter sp. GN70]